MEELLAVVMLVIYWLAYIYASITGSVKVQWFWYLLGLALTFLLIAAFVV